MTRALVTDSGVDLTRAHLIGVGGAGMSAIASVLLDRGLAVSGSDAKGSHVMTALAARGALVEVGQRAENLDLLPGGPTAVVASTAIRAGNPELVEAHRRGIAVVRRADALAALMTGRRAVCIAGTHGKTSTTSMLTVALLHAGMDPSFAIGGELNESGTGAHAGSGDVFVAEADESDGSFLAYRPFGAVVTTIEPDHLDHHGTARAYEAAFDEFVARIRPDGFLVAGVDDPGVQRLVHALRADGDAPRLVTYGRDSGADLTIASVTPHGHRTAAEVRLGTGETVRLSVDVPGEHMVANAVAALAVGIELGVDPATMAAGLGTFTGVRRRFEFVGRAGGVTVYDDYAHHPTEVAATVRAARAVAGDGRVVVVFQPHLYSRTLTFAEQFARALSLADVVVVLDVFGAREEPIPGVSGQLIVDAMDTSRGNVVFERSQAAVPARVAEATRPGDVVLTMGAGDVTLLGPGVVAGLAGGVGE